MERFAYPDTGERSLESNEEETTNCFSDSWSNHLITDFLDNLMKDPYEIIWPPISYNSLPAPYPLVGQDFSLFLAIHAGAKETLEEGHPEFRDLIRKTTYKFIRIESNFRREYHEEYGIITTSPELASNGKLYRELIEGSDMWNGSY